MLLLIVADRSTSSFCCFLFVFVFSFFLVGLRELGDAINEGKEVRAQSSKGLDDAGNNGFALGCGVAGCLIFLTRIRQSRRSKRLHLWGGEQLRP